MHWPRTQVDPPVQDRPHWPQCCSEFIRFTQLFPQLVWFSPQLAAQAPATQTWPAAQAMPHIPQFFTLVVRSTQAPAQVFRPEAQVHWPITQAAPVPQGLSHAPQWRRSVCTFTQVPPQAERPVGQPHVPPAQAWPAAHAIPHMPQFMLLADRSTQAAPQAVRPWSQADGVTPLGKVSVDKFFTIQIAQNTDAQNYEFKTERWGPISLLVEHIGQADYVAEDDSWSIDWPLGNQVPPYTGAIRLKLKFEEPVTKATLDSLLAR
jgi:hypothetical protein